MGVRLENLEQMIDNTQLSPTATTRDIEEFCNQGRHRRYACLIVSPCYLSFVRARLPNYRLGTVVGFPNGFETTESKIFQAENAISNGASDLDMVINIGALKSGSDRTVHQDIESVVGIARKQTGTIVKCIIETALLTQEEKILASKICKEAGANFVKTSTGLRGGATVDDIKLIRSVVGSSMGVKASGGIRTYDQAVAMIEAGANRIGTSHAAQILETTR